MDLLSTQFLSLQTRDKLLVLFGGSGKKPVAIAIIFDMLNELALDCFYSSEAKAKHQSLLSSPTLSGYYRVLRSTCSLSLLNFCRVAQERNHGRCYLHTHHIIPDFLNSRLSHGALRHTVSTHKIRK